TITPGGPTTFCTGGSVTLTSSSATGNQWLLAGNPIAGATNSTYVATGAGSYTLTVTTGGCTSAASAATVITVNPIPATPTITAGGPTTFCTGGSVTLTSSSATGNQWLLAGSPIAGATNTTYVATGAGSYTLTVTTGGCTSAASAATVVTVNPIPATPTITAGGPTTFCTGGSVTLTSSSATGNQWLLAGSPIAGATNNTYVATGAGSYTLTVTTGGCTSAASAATVVTVNPIPATPTITAPSTAGAGATNLIASVPSNAGATYAWTIGNGTITAGQGTSQITFTAGAVGTLTLAVIETSASGCASARGTKKIVIAGTLYYTAVPCRLLDTRDPSGPLGGPAIGSNLSRVFVTAGVCSIPTTARALSVNVTVVNTGAAGYLKLYRGDGAVPADATVISYGAGITRANNGLVQISSDGTGTLGIFNGTAVATNVIVDVTGWFE
ncbi:MAG: hypothetical protein ABIT01_03835, partial [Thermoanaerobaculia bacterium]